MPSVVGAVGMSVEKYRCHNIDKTAEKVSSILQSTLSQESNVDIDIDTSKVSSIVSISISIIDINNPGYQCTSIRFIKLSNRI